jgi:hypothetical protein
MDTLEKVKLALEALEKRKQIMKNNYLKNREKRLEQRKKRYYELEKPRLEKSRKEAIEVKVDVVLV